MAEEEIQTLKAKLQAAEAEAAQARKEADAAQQQAASFAEKARAERQAGFVSFAQAQVQSGRILPKDEAMLAATLGLLADAQPVQFIVEKMVQLWGGEASWQLDGADHPHEAHYLKLDCSKARSSLGWTPRWSLDQALHHIVNWHRAHQQGDDMRSITLNQIDSYIATSPL